MNQRILKNDGVLFFIHYGRMNSDRWVINLCPPVWHRNPFTKCLFQYEGFHNVITQHILMNVINVWIDVLGLANSRWGRSMGTGARSDEK